MPRELLKFRPGDSGLKIRKDGTMEVAGVDESGGMIDQNGKVNPALLFAAAWARKDQKVFEELVRNFKDAVLEGFFGPDAQRDYKIALEKQQENVAVKKEEPIVPFMKPDQIVEYGNEFETHSDVTAPSTGGVGPSSSGDVASGAVTFEQPEPMTVDEHLDRRDS